MTEHTRSFEIERVVPAAEAVALQRAEPAGADLLLQPRDKKHWLRKLLLTGASLIALAGAVYFGWHYWTVGRFEISTDDAYVKADNTTIAPKVSGYLAAVLVGDNERVKTGQVLARIDDRDFKVALDQATGVTLEQTGVSIEGSSVVRPVVASDKHRLPVDNDPLRVALVQNAKVIAIGVEAKSLQGGEVLSSAAILGEDDACINFWIALLFLQHF